MAADNCYCFSRCLNTETTDPPLPHVEQFSRAVLDAEIMEVMQCQSLTSDEKWVYYYKTLERHLYKKDPKFKPIQFKFDVREDNNGDPTYVLRSDQQESRFAKFLPVLIGPLISAAFSIAIRCW